MRRCASESASDPCQMGGPWPSNSSSPRSSGGARSTHQTSSPCVRAGADFEQAFSSNVPKRPPHEPATGATATSPPATRPSNRPNRPTRRGKEHGGTLARRRAVPSVHLHPDDFWHFIKQGWIAPYLPQAHQQNQTVVHVVAHAAFGYAAGGYQVICDGIVGPWFIDVFRTAGQTTASRSTTSSYDRMRPRRCTAPPDAATTR